MTDLHPVAIAVEPQRADAIQSALTSVDNMVVRIAKRLSDAGGDLNIVAPPPYASIGREAYLAQHAYRDTVCRLTRRVEPIYYMPDMPCYVTIDSDRVAAYKEETRERVEAEYSAFVAKLVRKIGDCDSAEIIGSHVWGHSILTVRKGSMIERWKTKQIVNRSVHGRLFNQWPSRKLK